MTECILDQPISSAWPVASDWLGAVEGVCQVRRRTLGRDHLLACSARWRDPEAARAARAGGQPALQQFEITGGTRPDLEPEPISQQAGVPPQPSAPPHPAGDRTSGLYRSTKPPGCQGRTTVGGIRSTRVAPRQTPDPAGDVPPFEHGHVDDPVLRSGPGPAARPAHARSERHGVDHLSHLIWSSASCSCRLGLPSCTRPGGWSQPGRHCVASTSVWLAVRVVRPGRRTGRDGHAATGRCSYRRQTAERVAWPSLRRRDRGVRQQRSVQSIVGNRTRWVNALTPPHRELLARRCLTSARYRATRTPLGRE